MHSENSKCKLARHLSALLAGSVPLLATVVIMIGSQPATVPDAESISSTNTRSVSPAAGYSFPLFNITQQTTAVNVRVAKTGNLFNHKIDALFDRFLFDTALLAFSSSGLPQSPVDALPLVSPTAVMTFVHAGKFTQDYTVVLDPGHGGSDPGTIGPDGLLEKELTLEIANRVRSLLLPHPNINIRLTRAHDRGFSRANRVKHIRAARGDLLVSLHLNNIPQRDLTVVESFYAGRENILESEIERRLQKGKTSDGTLVKASATRQDNYAYTDKSRRIAEILQRNIYQQVASGNPDAINAGVKKETLYTLTRSEMPATLIELTCLSNKSEEQRLKSPKYRQKIAESIAEGLLEYFSTLSTYPQGIIEGV